MNQKYSNLDEYTEILAKNAKKASKALRTLTADQRN